MKPIKIIAVFLLLSSALKAQTGVLFLDNSVIETDKQMHLASSFGVGLVSYVFFDTKEWTNEIQSVAYSMGVVTFLGFVKEWNDTNTTGFDWNDIKYNTIGAAIGITTAYFLRKKAKKYKTKEQKELKKLKLVYND